jgi:hypothetical protein
MRISSVAAIGLAGVVWLVPGCAKGGEEDNAAGEVKLSATHAMIGIMGLTSYDFPLKATPTPFTDFGDLLLSDKGTYTIRRGSTESGAAPYLLAKEGELVMLVPRSGASTLRWSGGYQIDTQPSGGLFFFTDRNPTYIGLYVGVQRVAAEPDLEDLYHGFGNRLVFPKTTVPDKANVGRAWSGPVAIDAAGAVTGTAKDSKGPTLTLGGSVQTFQDGGVVIDLEFKEGTTTEKRKYSGGAGKLVVLALHEDASDGDVGLLALVRRFKARPDPVRIAGEYFVGSHAIFVNPARPGTDATFGLLTLNDRGGWSLRATGSNNFTFTKSGSFTFADDGAMEFKEAKTGEVYPGAIDTDYATVVFVDATAQDTTNPEVELFLATRVKKP